MPLVTTKEMLKKAYEGGYAVGAFNINNMENIQAITSAANELNSPIILQVSAGAVAYAGNTYLKKLVEAAVIENPNIPIALHLDHGSDFEVCKTCIDIGFTSVMIDGSSKPLQENIDITKKVVEYAHSKEVVVEGELGKIAGIEDDINVNNSFYTNPNEVEEFVDKTGVDSLAIAIGTSHGVFKFKPGQIPQLRFDILEEISRCIPEFPIVLHGASSVAQEYVDIIHEHGGKLLNPIGVPEHMLRQAARMAVCKINIDSDLRLAMTAGIREAVYNNPLVFDPREFIKAGRSNLKNIVEYKIKNVLGSENMA